MSLFFGFLLQLSTITFSLRFFSSLYEINPQTLIPRHQNNHNTQELLPRQQLSQPDLTSLLLRFPLLPSSSPTTNHGFSRQIRFPPSSWS